jgi:myosin heavy subunit
LTKQATDTILLMQSSEQPVARLLFGGKPLTGKGKIAASTEADASTYRRAETVGSQYKHSLQLLIEKMSACRYGREAK